MLRMMPAMVLLCAVMVTCESRADTDQVTLLPIKDNSLIETTNSPMSNALGDGIYSGRTSFLAGFTLRRAVLAFDVADAIPPGSKIESVTLDLSLVMAASPSETHTLHRLLADWGEGTSSHPGGAGAPATPGDATWMHTFYPDQFWNEPGGDFVAAPSAGQTVTATPGLFTWGSTPEMVADVQNWLDDPASNFGWIVIGNEQDPGTARKFASREHSEADLRPRLQVTFTSQCRGPADLNCDGVVDGADLLILLSAWGECADCDDCLGNLNDDCTVDGADLLILLSNWG